MDKWIDFYARFFDNTDDARKFVEDLEVLALGHPRHSAKIMMHQAQRLISIADDLPAIRKGKESLQLVFLLICAENIAKIHDNFDDDGLSRAYVRQFFQKFIVDEDRRLLEESFTNYARSPLDFDAVANALYSVRCDVVHEGKYWGFQFWDGTTPMLNGDPDVVVSITFGHFRDVVVRGCIRAIGSYPGRTKS